MADNDFGLKSNVEQSVSKESAVAQIDKVANAKPDFGVAQLDGKKVTDTELKTEFEIGHKPPPDDKKGEAERETVVETETEKKGEAETKPDDKKVDDKKVDDKGVAIDTETQKEDLESVADWLKEVTPETRQDILDQFVVDNIDELVIDVKQAGEDVPMSIAELKRAASGYAGETQATKKVNESKADIARREKALKEREQFIGKQFKDPVGLMTFLDANVENPVEYFKAVQEHAAALLAEAEDNPARFRRDSALRRDQASLRTDISDIKKMIRSGQNGDGTPDADADAETERQQAIVDEGVRRREVVVENGFKVDAVAKAYADDKEPDDFDRWFTKYALAQSKDTSEQARETTKENRQRGGATLRRRGPSTPKPATDDELDVMTPAGIDKFLRNHPSNKGRYPR